MCQEKNFRKGGGGLTLCDTLTHELGMDPHGPSIVPCVPCLQ
jgi:hypothetical protein